MAQAGTVFFDGGCGLCSTAAGRWERWLGRRGFDLVALQDPRAAEALKEVENPGASGEMLLLTPDGRVLGSVDAIDFIARSIRWAYPFHLLLKITPLRRLARWGYAALARRRHQISGACGLRPLDATSGPKRP